MVRNDERFLDNVVANMQMTIIKAEIREIYIIIDEGFHLLFRPVSEENIGKAGLFNSSTFSINQFYTGQGWIEGDNVVLYKIIVGFFSRPYVVRRAYQWGRDNAFRVDTPVGKFSAGNGF